MSARGRIVEQFEMSQMAKNGVSNYRKIELPQKVIIRTETLEEVGSTKQAKIRKEGMMPPKPEEGIGKNGGKIAKRAEETRMIWIEKQAKIGEEGMMPPKPEEGIGKNGGKIAKMPKKVAVDKMKTSNRIMKKSNRILTELHTSVPLIYYVMMGFGLASAIFGAFAARSYPVYYSIMIGGLGVFLVASIGFLEIRYTKRILKKAVE